MLRASRAHRQEAKLYYTFSGIITPLGGRPVHTPNLCTGLPPVSVMIPEAVKFNFDLLTMNT